MVNTEPKGKIIAEDALNLELKYIDDAVITALVHLQILWEVYENKGSARPLVPACRRLLMAIIPTNRLEKNEIKDFKEDLEKVRLCIDNKGNTNKRFFSEMEKFIHTLMFKVADVRLVSRPPEEAGVDIVSSLLKDIEKEDAEALKEIEKSAKS